MRQPAPGRCSPGPIHTVQPIVFVKPMEQEQAVTRQPAPGRCSPRPSIQPIVLVKPMEQEQAVTSSPGCSPGPIVYNP